MRHTTMGALGGFLVGVVSIAGVHLYGIEALLALVVLLVLVLCAVVGAMLADLCD